MTTGIPIVRHLRPRTGEEQETTGVELFFDLVYVLAVTQLAHLLIEHLTWAGFGRTVFLLGVVWWAWIFTTWMVNWFDPGSGPVRLLLLLVMGASLLMSSAIPDAFGEHGLLFAGAYVALQVGRNVGGAILLPNDHALRRNFLRYTAWSVAAGVLWIAGALLLDGGDRIGLWGPALIVELVAPLVWFRTPGLGPMEEGHPVEGGHFAERFQGFVLIALGETIVVTGATAQSAGLTTTVAAALALAFVQTGALWWLYFGETAVHSRRFMRESDQVLRLARDAYTYLHVPIVLGIILSAVGDDLLLAHPDETLETAGALVTVGGPLLFLAGETLFRVRMIGNASPKRLTAIAGLVVLFPVAFAVSALALAVLVALLLSALAAWEYPWRTGLRGDLADVE